MSYRVVVNAKHAKREEAIRETVALITRELSKAEQRITSSSSTFHLDTGQIVQAIEEGQQWTSTQVVTAFIKPAIRAQDETNCITEVMFSDALRTASELDGHFTTTKELEAWTIAWRPDQFQRPHLPAKYVKLETSLWSKPMSLKIWQTSNVRTHRGTQPRTLPMRSTSVVGLVKEKARFWRWVEIQYWRQYEDSGAFLWTVRSQTGFRKGQLTRNSGAFTLSADPNPGFKSIPTVSGSMTRTTEDIKIASRVVFGKTVNHSSAPVPYCEVKLGRKSKFGYYFDDGMARITPACHRAGCETVEVLRKQGHEHIELGLPSLGRCPRHSYLSH
ncbi:hypothetical protein BDM02DRAFT_3263754 [Thelephora ganbajun]|uniref:Uncharacterized protein n=1 Tax=Thelephora ganbajun TaxID=370292 RepID=A0ACB6Z3F9_THEGA|nr:hypothetical protein BDM02DRAFT_3263754 [Thelephora ganbajun]